ncbi:hypothetical protein ABTL66_19620, partial [Acinetobacter baumannii]
MMAAGGKSNNPALTNAGATVMQRSLGSNGQALAAAGQVLAQRNNPGTIGRGVGGATSMTNA